MHVREFINDRPLELWNDGSTLVGYAAVFYRAGDASTEYHPQPEITERVERGAFREIIERGDEVLGIVNHERHSVLARRSNNTLSIEEDSIGLRFKMDLPSTTLARDTVENTKHGVFGGASIGFLPGDIQREFSDDGVIRTHTNIKLLHHAGPVIEPAFEGTTVAMRCRDALSEEYAEEMRALRINARMAELQKQFEEAT